MKVLGINATYLSPEKRKNSLGEDPIEQTRRMLSSIPNLTLATSYSEGIEIIKNSFSYDVIITSFTPYSIIHPNDKFNVITNDISNIKKFKTLNESYFTAYLYLDELIKQNPFAKYIIYSGAYSGLSKPSNKEINFLSERLRNYTWINKGDNYQVDKKKYWKQMLYKV